MTTLYLPAICSWKACISSLETESQATASLRFAATLVFFAQSAADSTSRPSQPLDGTAPGFLLDQQLSTTPLNPTS